MPPDAGEHNYSSANDLAYLLAGGGRTAAHRPAIGPVNQKVSGAFADMLALFKQRLGQATGRADWPILFDCAAILGRNRANTSKLLPLAPPQPAGSYGLVIYLQQARLPFDEYVVAHELAHNILYCQGLGRLEALTPLAPHLLQLLSAISTTTSHFLVHPLMVQHGFNVRPHQTVRLRRFRSALAGAPASAASVVTAVELSYFGRPEASMESLCMFSTPARVQYVAVRRIVQESGLPQKRDFPTLAAARRHLLDYFRLTAAAGERNPLARFLIQRR